MTTNASHPAPLSAPGPARLHWVLVIVFLVSLGTGVFWHGLAFIAKHSYGFDQTRNLTLYALMGTVYTIGAFNAARVTRAIERFVSPRLVLGLTVGGQGVACVVPVVFASESALWVSAGVTTIASALTWPVLESYLTAGRHGPDMRSAISWFNMVWMPAVVVPMFAIAPLVEEHGAYGIGGVAVTSFAAVGLLGFLPARPAPHDHELASAHVTSSYPFLLRSARVLLPLSYVLSSVMSPLLPYRFEQIAIDVAWETPATATYLVMRIVVVVVMWRIPFWHGKWSTLVTAAATLVLGFAAVVLAPTLPVMLAGFVSFGIGLGIVYHAALYYGMAVGAAAVDASGTHEALIGAGYAAGPLTGLIGTAIAGPTGVVGLAAVIVGVSAVPAVRPYLRWRRAGRGTGGST